MARRDETGTGAGSGSLPGRLLHFRFVRYLLVGLAGAAIDYSVFHTVLGALSAPMPVAAKGVANVCGMLAGAVFCFLLNRSYSFSSKGHMGRQAVAYATLLGVNLFLSSGLIYMLTAHQRMRASIAKLVVMACIIIWNYAVSRFFIFT